MKNEEILLGWLESARGEDLEEIKSSEDAMSSVASVVKKMDKGIITIVDGHIIQKLKRPIGETTELKYKQFYTARDQQKAARNMKSEGELSMAHNLIACLTDKTQGEIGKLVDKDIATASEVEALYFL